MLSVQRQLRVRAIEALEILVKQFRPHAGVWPFRVPGDPIDLTAILDRADAVVPLDALRSRSVLRLEWLDGGVWDLWVIALPTAVQIYCDSDGHESRILASVKRGSAAEADGFFLERLAESGGGHFGIEMTGPPPVRVRSAIGDREFLADVFVELFEGTGAETALRGQIGDGPDFKPIVGAWLDGVLSGPPAGRRQPRLREQPEAG